MSFQKETRKNMTRRFLYFSSECFFGYGQIILWLSCGAKGIGNCLCTKNGLLWEECGDRDPGLEIDTESEIEASGVITCRVGHVSFYSFCAVHFVRFHGDSGKYFKQEKGGG